MNLVGMAHIELFQNTEAERILTEGHEICQNLKGPHSISTLALLRTIGCVYREQGRLEEAKLTAMPVLEGARKNASGHEDVLTLQAMRDLILVYLLRGQWKQAQELGEKNLSAMTHKLGPNNPNTITMKSTLFCIYYEMGWFSDCERLSRETLDYWENYVAQGHPRRIIAASNLAAVYTDRGRLTEAEKMFEDILTICKRSPGCGPRHIRTLKLAVRLATVRNCLGKSRESIEVLEHIIATMKEVMGSEHYETLTAMSNLSVMYLDNKQYTRAEDLGLQTFYARKKTLGDEHPSTLLSLQNLAVSKKANGKKADAIRHLSQFIELQERVMSKDHFRSQVCRDRLNSWLGESNIVNAARESRYADVQTPLNDGVDP